MDTLYCGYIWIHYIVGTYGYIILWIHMGTYILWVHMDTLYCGYIWVHIYCGYIWIHYIVGTYGYIILWVHMDTLYCGYIWIHYIEQETHLCHFLLWCRYMSVGECIIVLAYVDTIRFP